MLAAPVTWPTGSSRHVCSSQVLYGGKDGRGLQAQYVVLDSDGDRLVPTHSLAPTHTDGPVRSLRPLGRSFFFPGGKPPSASFCWFSPEEACSGGVFSDLHTLWELSNYKPILTVPARRCCVLSASQSERSLQILTATQFVVVKLRLSELRLKLSVKLVQKNPQCVSEQSPSHTVSHNAC